MLKQKLSAFLVWSWVGIRTGMIEMRAHVLRSSLSAIGVLFGVFVMVVMLSFIGGLNRFLRQRIGEWMGTVMIFHMHDTPEEQKALFSRSPGLRFSDGTYLEENVDAVDRVYKSIMGHGSAVTAAGETHAHLRGVDAYTLGKEFTTDIPFIIKEGRTISEEEYRNGERVCIISEFLAEEIRKKLRQNGTENPEAVGTSLQYNNQRIKIIGVFGPEKGEMRRGWMRFNIYTPILAVQKYVLGYNPDPGFIRIQVADPLKMDAQMDDIVAAMLYKHRGVEDFEYRTPDNLKEFVDMMNNVSNIMAFIAFISLLAGGLGIMNVMLSSISERVREIGVRKALGASNTQLFVQFIAETSTLCFVGGLIGAALGCIPMLFGEAIEEATNGVILPQLLPHYIFGVLMILVFMGVVFGLYPAVKASRMNPIDALRYE